MKYARLLYRAASTVALVGCGIAATVLVTALEHYASGDAKPTRGGAYE